MNIFPVHRYALASRPFHPSVRHPLDHQSLVRRWAHYFCHKLPHCTRKICIMCVVCLCVCTEPHNDNVSISSAASSITMHHQQVIYNAVAINQSLIWRIIIIIIREPSIAVACSTLKFMKNNIIAQHQLCMRARASFITHQLSFRLLCARARWTNDAR